MQFEHLGETATITFDMTELETLAKICNVAIESGEDYLLSVYREAFTAAALIARVHGDISEENRVRMAAIHARLKGEDDATEHEQEAIT